MRERNYSLVFEKMMCKIFDPFKWVNGRPDERMSIEKENKVFNDLQQKNFIEALQKNVMKISSSICCCEVTKWL